MEPATNLESRYTSQEKYIKLHKLHKYIQSLYRIIPIFIIESIEQIAYFR